MGVDVSVIIAVHNGAETLERAVRSALEQTRSSLEVIAVDDGSTDSSWEILESLSRLDSRVVPTRRSEASGGPAVPRNEGLKRSQGKFLALLDQDDYWYPEKLAKQLALFQDDSIGVVYSDATIQGDVTYLEAVNSHGEPPTGDVLAEILRWNFVPTCTAIWRKEVSQRVGEFSPELSTVDDRDYWIRAARAGFQFGYCDEPLAHYTTSGTRLSDDTARHARLVVLMWERYAQQSPNDETVKAALRQSRRFASHIIARERMKHRGVARVRLFFEALGMCPEPRNLAKILLGRIGSA